MADKKLSREKLQEKVRVKVPKNAEVTMSAALAEMNDLTPLNKPATDANGVALPAKYPPASRPAKAPADTEKEK